MQAKYFIGRQKELKTILDELSQSDQFRDPSRIFYLRGQAGIGKKAFYSELAKHLGGARYNVLWIRPVGFINSRYPAEWSEELVNSMAGNNGEANAKVKSFKAAWSEAPMQPALASGAERQLGYDGADENEDARMQQWLELFMKYVQNGGPRKGQPKSRIIFVLDDYDKLSAEKKLWFARCVFEPLVANIPDMDVRFLLSGEQSFSQSLDLESYWIPFQNEVEEVQLSPFSPKETEELVRRFGVPLGKVDAHEKTGGVPARIMELVKMGGGATQKEQPKKLDDVDRYLMSKSEEKRNWILGAVHLQAFNTESLNIFGTIEGARKALTMLRNEPRLKVIRQSKGYRMDAEWAEAIINWQEQNHPEQYRQFANRVQKFREVLQNIKNYEHRQMLAKLSVLNFFNEDLIRKVYNGNAEALITFLNSNLTYFIKTPFNYQISVQYQPFVQNYSMLIPIEDKQRLKEKAAYIWGKKKKEYSEELAKLDEKLTDSKDQYEGNKVLLDPLLEQVRRRRRQMERTDKLATKLEAQKVQIQAKQPKFLCNFMKIFGVIMILVGLATLSSSSWTYIIFGLFFIGTALMWPATVPQDEIKQAKRKIQTRSRADSMDDDADTLVNMLNLKRVSLENRAGYLSMNLAKYQRKMRELDMRINEPYV